MRWLIQSAVTGAAFALAATSATVALAAAATQASPPITAVWQPLNSQLEVLYANNAGAVLDIFKANNQPWNPPVQLAPAGSAPPHAHVSVVWQVQDEHLEAFWVDGNGAVELIWKAHNGPWHERAAITPAGFAPPGSPLTSVWQPVRHELMVFGLGGDGQLNMVWKKDESKWMTSPPMTGGGFGVPGEELSAIYQPVHEHIEVFAVNPQGAIDDEWKSADGNWSSGPLTASGAAPAGASVSAAWEPANEHLEVLFVDGAGQYNTMWKQHDGAWQVFKEGPAGVAPAGAPISAAYQPLGQQLEAFSIGNDGAIADLWKQNDGAWNGPLATAPAGSAVPGGDIYAVLQPDPSQLEVMYWDSQGQLWDSFKQGNAPWDQPIRLTGSDGASKYTQPYCTDYWTNWYKGSTPFDIVNVVNCEAYVSQVCRAWRLGGSELFVQSDNDVLMILPQIPHDPNNKTVMTPILNTAGDWTFGGNVVVYHGPVGTGNEGAGDIYEGVFDPRNGDLSFQLNGYDKPDRSDMTIHRYLGKITSIGMSDTAGDITGNYDQGTWFDPKNGNSSGGWTTPVPGQAAVAFCLKQDVTLPINSVNLIPQAPPPPITNPPPAGRVIVGLGTLPLKGGDLAIATANTAAPAAGGLPTTPSPAPGVSFTGQWVSFVQNGVVYVLSLTQDTTGHVSGQYSAGTITDGVVIGRDLFADWAQSAATGTLQFHMAPDNTTFSGFWTQGAAMPTPQDAKGIWDGYNLAFYTKPTQQGDFSGAFALNRGAAGAEPLRFVLSGSNIAGSYPDGTISGAVAHQQGRPTALTASVADSGLAGRGTFYLYPDGTGFSGYWHGSDNSLAAWSATADAAQGSNGPGAGASETIPTAPSDMVPLAPSPTVQQPLQPAPVAETPQQSATAQPAAPVQQPVAVAKIPRGQCPAATATVTSAVNVHDGESGAVLPPAIAGGTLVQCTACDASWCLVADSNPHATVSRRFLDFTQPEPQAPVEPPAQQPAAVQPPPPEQPQAPTTAAAAPRNFGGVWIVTNDKQYSITITQDGANATGKLVGQGNRPGTLTGTIDGSVFTYQWTEDGVFIANGTFTLSGARAITGTYLNADGSSGSWTGFKLMISQASPPPTTPDNSGPVDFGGCAACAPPSGDIVVK